MQHRSPPRPLAPPPEWNCVDCGYRATGRRGLMIHRSHSHKSEWTAPNGYEHFPLPWHEMEPVDRGFELECWISNISARNNRRHAQRVVEIRDGIKSDMNIVVMHLCEKWREPNACLRPEHLVLGSKSDNAKRQWELSPVGLWGQPL